MVNSWAFKDDESKSEAKTNSRSGVCPLLVEDPHLACVEHAQCPLLAHCVKTHTHTQSALVNDITRYMGFWLHLLFTHQTADHTAMK